MFMMAITAVSILVSTAEATPRMSKKVGVYATRNGDPHPSYVGVNLGYNVSDGARLFGGVGTTTQFETDNLRLGGGLKLLVPKWQLSPFAGIALSDASNGLYWSGGLDWQAMSGFNLGVGYNKQFASGTTGDWFGQIGYFF